LSDEPYSWLDRVHIQNLDLSNREIYLIEANQEDSPGVDFRMVNRFIKNMRILEIQSNKYPILIHLNTPGGYVSSAFSIYDRILSCPAWVTMLCYNDCESASSFIFQAADRRVMMPNCSFMIHSFHIWTSGNIKASKESIDYCLKQQEVYQLIYVTRMKESKHGKFYDWDIDKISRFVQKQIDVKEEVWLTAQEAVDWGLADEIFDGDWEGLILEKKT